MGYRIYGLSFIGLWVHGDRIYMGYKNYNIDRFGFRHY